MLVPGEAAIPYLDGWRGLAILAVLAAHFGPRPIVDPLGQIGCRCPALAGAALGLGAGVLSCHLFEDPVRRGLNRVWSQRSSAAGAAQPLSLPADGKTGAAKP